jgi:hypothetical protein
MILSEQAGQRALAARLTLATLRIADMVIDMKCCQILCGVGPLLVFLVGGCSQEGEGNCSMPNLDSATVVEFHPNGRKAGEGFTSNDRKDGTKEGLWFYWYETGKPRASRHYRHGQQEGREIRWYRSGAPEASGVLVNGEREGPWIGWNEDGTINNGTTGQYEKGKKMRGFSEAELRELQQSTSIVSYR